MFKPTPQGDIITYISPLNIPCAYHHCRLSCQS